MSEFYGKYRGKVESNVDPMMLGRIQVSVPAVLGAGSLSWAMPCTPYGGSGVGFFAVPPVGANVWVEFESGDPDYPIWTGCFWETGEVPAVPAQAGIKVLKTDATTITISDLPGVAGGTIETTMGTKISMTAQVVEIANGKGASIRLTGPQVSINNGALEVT